VAKIVAHKLVWVLLIAAALMHDVVEDTDITVSDIEKMFNPKIAKLLKD
jgi:GTP diphosphokinase / guanosine-3',5'-bis(diphosphate) 3'-diphosphatase